MHETDEICNGTEHDDCNRTLRAREHGPERSWPRTSRETEAFVSASEIDQCVAYTRAGDRCETDISNDNGAHCCGTHGRYADVAAQRGFVIAPEAYGDNVVVDIDDDGVPRNVRVEMTEHVGVNGTEYECAVHGRGGRETRTIEDAPVPNDVVA